jgi:hypothetical protein
MRDGRKADIQVGPSRPSNGGPFEGLGVSYSAGVVHIRFTTVRGNGVEPEGL